MRDLDTTFDQIKALRLVCKSLDAVCLPRVLRYFRLFSRDEEDVLENFRHFNDVLSSNLSHTSELLIPNWEWIRRDKNFIAFRDMPGPGGAMAVILLNTLVAPFVHLFNFVVPPHIL